MSQPYRSESSRRVWVRPIPPSDGRVNLFSLPLDSIVRDARHHLVFYSNRRSANGNMEGCGLDAERQT